MKILRDILDDSKKKKKKKKKKEKEKKKENIHTKTWGAI